MTEAFVSQQEDTGSISSTHVNSDMQQHEPVISTLERGRLESPGDRPTSLFSLPGVLWAKQKTRWIAPEERNSSLTLGFHIHVYVPVRVQM